MLELEFQKLSESNFKDYEELTSCQSGGGCYCAFWHQKWSSLADWDLRKKEAPELNRATVLDKVRSHFHVGVLVYAADKLVAWVSVGPIIDSYWCWRRVTEIGSAAKTIAGITCITVHPQFRKQGMQVKILRGLAAYGREQGWTAIEGYPFEPTAVARHGSSLLWPGIEKGFLDAGFVRTGPHWLTQPGYSRSTFVFHLSEKEIQPSLSFTEAVTS